MRCKICNGLHDVKDGCVQEDVVILNPAQFPTSSHWAIIVFDDVAYDDGYGGTGRHNYGEYRAYFSEDAWKEKITNLSLPTPGYGMQKKFVAFRTSGKANIKPSFSVDVDNVVL